MISPKEFLVRSGIHPSLGERESDYTIVVDGYRREVEESSQDRLIKYRKEVFEELFDGEIPERVRELLEVALATFAADRLVKRGPTESAGDDERMLSSRQIRIVYPVSDIDLWKGVEDELSHAVSFISRDNFEYRFVEAHNSRPQESLPKKAGSDNNHDCISLFSGGLDSLGGVHYLRQKDYHPRFVSINHGRNVGHVVNHFSTQLGEDLISIGVNSAFSGYESTQFTRSLMYLAFATAAAIGTGVDRIFIPENGILARFPMLKHGWTTTRTVHPTFIGSYNRLLDSLFPTNGIEVENPFLNHTKTEVVNYIPASQEALYTRTCPHPRGLSVERDDEGHPMNCGLCIPCLIREISLVTSRHQIPMDNMALDSNPMLELDFESVRHHGMGKLNNTVLSGSTGSYKQTSIPVFLIGLNQVLSFAYRVRQETQTEFASNHLEALDDEVYELYSRFSGEVFDFVDSVCEANQSMKPYVEHYLSISTKGRTFSKVV